MFRMWGKIWKDNRLVKDTVACISDYSLSPDADGISGPGRDLLYL